jgi:hypothetical protein
MKPGKSSGVRGLCQRFGVLERVGSDPCDHTAIDDNRYGNKGSAGAAEPSVCRSCGGSSQANHDAAFVTGGGRAEAAAASEVYEAGRTAYVAWDSLQRVAG